VKEVQLDGLVPRPDTVVYLAGDAAMMKRKNVEETRRPDACAFEPRPGVAFVLPLDY
jgi:hypothetical protein